MVLPVLYVVEFVCVGVFGGEAGITERDVGGVGNVAEAVELSAPRTTQTTGVVDLKFVPSVEAVCEE